MRCILLSLLILLAPAADAARVRSVSHPAPAGAGITIARNFEVAEPLIERSVGRAYEPHIAFGGGIYFVTWSGGRYASRLDAAGRPLDPVPTELLPIGDAAISNVVFHDGSFVFVVTRERELSLVRVRLDGTMLPPRALNLQGSRVAIATNGRELLIGAADSEFRLIAIDAAGNATERLLETRLTHSFAIASDGRDFAVTWWAGTDIQSQRVAASGALLGQPVTLGTGRDPAIASNGSEYLVVWTDFGTIRGARLLADGTATAPVEIVSRNFGEWHPAIAWDGTSYRMIWKSETALYNPFGTFPVDTVTARLSPDGTLLERTVVAPASDATNRYAGFIDRVDVTTAGGEAMFVWSAGVVQPATSNTRDIFAKRASDPPQLLTRRATSQRSPAPAPHAGRMLVAWSDFRHAEDGRAHPAIVYTIVDEQSLGTAGGGRVLFPDETRDQYTPVAASNGVDTFLVWREAARHQDMPQRLVAARIGPNGEPLDRERIVIATGPITDAAIECGPSDCLVVWSDTPGAPAIRGFAARLSPAGVLLDATPLSLGYAVPGGITRGNGEYAVAVRNEQALIEVIRIRDGAISGRTVMSPERERFVYDADPDIAWSGSNYLVTWQRSTPDIRFRLLDAHGNLAGPEWSNAAGGYRPRVEWNGRHYVILWTTPHGQERPALQLHATRVTRDGTLVDGTGFPIVTEAAVMEELATAMLPNGALGVAYTRPVNQRPYFDASRVFAAFLRE